MEKKKKPYYVSNERFQYLMVEYNKNKKDEKIKNEIGEIFIKISKKIANMPSFSGYTYDRKDDMLSDSTYFMYKYIDRYDPERGAPFAYFSSICFNAYRQCLNKQKKFDDFFVPIGFLENMNSEGHGLAD